jgi:phage gp16-like protein
MSERAAKSRKAPATRGANKHRDAEIKKIQIAKRWALANLPGFDDETYRDLLQEAGGKRSCTELDWRGRMAVLKRFAELGWVAIPAKKAHTTPAPGESVCRRQADDDQSKMCRGLWIELHTLGEVRNPSEKALNGFAKRMTKIADLSWCKDDQKYVVIEALKDMRARRTLKLMSDRLLKDYQYALPDVLSAALQVVLRGLRIGEQPAESAMKRLGMAGYQLLIDYKRWEAEAFTRS